MANSNGWGDGASNNNIGWGKCAINNSIGWGSSQLTSWSGATDIDGGDAPTNTVAPAITGTAQEGQTLTCSTGTWTGSPTYTYQWKRNGSNIGSATNSTYTLVTADVGQSIKCTVTATNILGSASADSNTVTPTSAIPPIITTNLVMNLDAGDSSSYPGTGTTWTDLTGNSRNGTLINGVGYSSLNNGYLTFDGTNDYVSVANLGAVLNNVNKFTIDTWFKLNNAALNNTIFSFGNNGYYADDILIGVYGSTLLAQVNSGGDGSATIGFTSTAWTNLQVVYDGTLTGNANRLKIYINGVLQTVSFTYTVPASTSNLNFSSAGIGAYSTGGFVNFLNGNISITRLYSNSLSQSNVTQNFNAIKTRYGL